MDENWTREVKTSVSFVEKGYPIMKKAIFCLFVFFLVAFRGDARDYVAHAMRSDSSANAPWRWMDAESSSVSRSERTPMEWSFRFVKKDSTPVYSPDSLVIHRDTFPDSTNRFSVVTTTASTEHNRFYVSGNAITLVDSGTSTNETEYGVLEKNDSVLMPNIWIEATITPVSFNTINTSNTYTNGFFGLIADTNTWIGFQYETYNKQLSVVHSISGSYVADLKNTSLVTSEFPAIHVAMELIGTQATFFYKSGSTWNFLITVTLASDLRYASNRTIWRMGFMSQKGKAYSGNSTFSFSDYKFGYFGYLGRRDISVVINPDGTPYVENDSIVYVATSNSDYAAGGTYRNSYFGIEKLNLKRMTMIQTGLIFTNQYNSLASNDGAGQIVRMNDTAWHFFAATWAAENASTTNVKIIHHKFDSNPLHGASLVTVDTIQFGSNTYNYDPSFLYDSASSLWWCALTKSSGAPFTQIYTSPDLTTWTLNNSDTDVSYEGCKLYNIAGEKFVQTTASFANPDTGFRVFSLYNFTRRGTLDVRTPGTANTIIPWCQAIPYHDSVIAMTFDTTRYGVRGTFNWGAVRYYKSPRYR
jgi:hypothetical protein